MLPSVLPCVPLPLPGAPKRMNVLYFMGRYRYTAKETKSEGTKPAPKKCQPTCLLRGLQGTDLYPSTGAIEANIPVDQRENCVIATETYIFPRQKFRAALTHNDVTRHDQLASKSFYSEPFADAVAAILNAALSFFM